MALLEAKNLTISFGGLRAVLLVRTVPERPRYLTF